MNVQEFEATNFQELITELAEKNDKLLKDYYSVAQTCDEHKDEIARLKKETDEAYRKGATEAAIKIMHYLYPLWQDTTSKNVAIGKTLDWIKATFKV